MPGHTTSVVPAKPGDTPRGRRSRITTEREAEIYTAVLDLLREVGYEALTMDAIAARARSSKATLYRQWTGKSRLVAKAIRHQKPAVLSGIDTGALRSDFDAVVTQMNDRQMERDTALIRSLAHAVHGDPDLFQALRELFVVPELTGLDVILTRAIERGGIAADTPALAYFCWSVP